MRLLVGALGHGYPGQLRSAETVRAGLDAAPGALVGVLDGANTGKMLVRL